DANAVVIPEGFRTDQVVARLAKTTGVKKAELEKALKDADGLGLPDYAEGEAEGYLFPAKYSFAPDDTALDMLAAMVKRYKAVAEEVPVSGASEAGLDEHDFITMASIIEKEVNRPEDMPAVAEVIFNRLDGSCVEQGIPKGLLQMDSTVHFLEGGGAGSVYTSAEARESDSPYNTYKQAGLPPGPIASPGQAAMEAILEPTDKGYCFFVAVDLDTGETRFARTGAEHTANTQLLQEWCRENSGRCG
ncbi:MAG TPA: endolytic transglycosylase MltG, partial [Nocardioides sp.]